MVTLGSFHFPTFAANKQSSLSFEINIAYIHWIVWQWLSEK